VFISVSVSVADEEFVTDSVAVAVVPATITSGYETDTVNAPLGEVDDSDDATAVLTRTAPAAMIAVATRATRAMNDFKRDPLRFF